MLGCSECFSKRLSTQDLTIGEEKRERKSGDSDDEKECQRTADKILPVTLKGLFRDTDHFFKELMLPCC